MKAGSIITTNAASWTTAGLWWWWRLPLFVYLRCHQSSSLSD